MVIDQIKQYLESKNRLIEEFFLNVKKLEYTKDLKFKFRFYNQIQHVLNGLGIRYRTVTIDKNCPSIVSSCLMGGDGAPSVLIYTNYDFVLKNKELGSVLSSIMVSNALQNFAKINHYLIIDSEDWENNNFITWLFDAGTWSTPMNVKIALVIIENNPKNTIYVYSSKDNQSKENSINLKIINEEIQKSYKENCICSQLDKLSFPKVILENADQYITIDNSYENNCDNAKSFSLSIISSIIRIFKEY